MSVTCFITHDTHTHCHAGLKPVTVYLITIMYCHQDLMSFHLPACLLHTHGHYYVVNTLVYEGLVISQYYHYDTILATVCY
jgi:hypothetical protein